MNPEENVSTKKPRKSLLVPTIISCLLSAIIVGSITYFVESEQSNDTRASLQSQVDTLKSQITQARSSLTPRLLAGWQTYINSNLGITFKYPRGYVVEMSTIHDGAVYISNHPQVEVSTITDVPSDWVAVDITATVQAKTDWTTGLTNTQKSLPTLMATDIKTADGLGSISYYKLYSSQASDYSLTPGGGRLGMLDAFLQLNNGKTFRASNIDNYDWTPTGSDEKGATLLLQILGSAE